MATATRRPTLAVYITPTDIAESRGINVLKVLLWIKSGELRAVNVAASRAGKLPRWRISPADLEAFDAARMAVPQSPVARRPRQKSGHVVEYF
jgi:hypothetical protein